MVNSDITVLLIEFLKQKKEMLAHVYTAARALQVNATQKAASSKNPRNQPILSRHVLSGHCKIHQEQSNVFLC